MKKDSKSGMFRGLSAVFLSLTILTMCLTSVANANSAILNRELGTTNYITRQTGDSDTDTAYYKSEFTSVEDLEAAKHELAVRLAAEGSVLLKNNSNALPLQAGSESVTVWGLNSLFPTLGGMMGSSVMASTDAGQSQVGILDATGGGGCQLPLPV